MKKNVILGSLLLILSLASGANLFAFKGDLDGDGHETNADVALLRQDLSQLSIPYRSDWDFDDDGQIDFYDLKRLKDWVDRIGGITLFLPIRHFIFDTLGNPLNYDFENPANNDLEYEGNFEETGTPGHYPADTWPSIDYKRKGVTRGWSCLLPENIPPINIQFESNDRFPGRSTYPGYEERSMEYRKVRFTSTCETYLGAYGTGYDINVLLREYVVYSAMRKFGIPTFDVINFGHIRVNAPESPTPVESDVMLLQRDDDRWDEVPFGRQFNLNTFVIYDDEYLADYADSFFNRFGDRLTHVGFRYREVSGGPLKEVRLNLDRPEAIRKSILTELFQHRDWALFLNEEYIYNYAKGNYEIVPFDFEWSFLDPPTQTFDGGDVLTRINTQVAAADQPELKTLLYQSARDFYDNPDNLHWILNTTDQYPFNHDRVALKHWLKFRFYALALRYGSRAFAADAGLTTTPFTNETYFLREAFRLIETPNDTFRLADIDTQKANLLALINQYNLPPQLGDLADVTSGTDQSVIVPLVLSDDHTPVQTLVKAIQSSNPTLIPSSEIGFFQFPSDPILFFTPEPGQSGTSNISVRFTDEHGRYVEDSFVLTVLPTNTPPTITQFSNLSSVGMVDIGPINYTVGDRESPLTLRVKGHSSDPTVIPVGNIFLNGSGVDRVLRLRPVTDRGETDITLTVTDPSGLTAQTIFHVTITPGNTPPTLEALGDVSTLMNQAVTIPLILNDDQTPVMRLQLVAESSDESLLPVSGITFEQNETPPTLVLTPASGLTGTSTVQVKFTDEQGEFVEDSFVVTVYTFNTAPWISMIDDVETQGTADIGPIEFTVRDQEDTPEELTVAAVASNPILFPLGNIFLNGTGESRTLTLRPALDQGESDITLVVTDSAGAFEETTFHITVNAVLAPAPSGMWICESNLVIPNQQPARYCLPVSLSDNLSAQVVNSDGDRIKTLAIDQGVAETTFEWNGTNQSGESVASGLYLLLVHGSKISPQTKKVVVVK